MSPPRLESSGGSASSAVGVTATAIAHPSLALVKYWGKQREGINIPATGSIGVSLAALTTTTTVTVADVDSLEIDGQIQPTDRYRPFFDHLRREIRRDLRFHVTSRNDFPTAAGLASSASGYAALTVAAFAAAEAVETAQGGTAVTGYAVAANVTDGTGATEMERTPAAGEVLPVDRTALSRVARLGSGSASRSVFGGFVRWDAGAETARQIRDASWWEEVRVVVLPLEMRAKPVSSREAMNRSRDTSPAYPAWVTDAPPLVERAERAIARRDLNELGTVMRLSYLRMFSTMISADPPLIYWLPSSVETIHRLEELRRGGIAAWETMDAGPQVKVLVAAGDVDAVVSATRELCASPPIVSTVGGPATLVPAVPAEGSGEG
ncbi:MAG: diphosphomevalonate/mevalonate 3,5-bisphosphate decarboxylase family protein [Alkalispirochaeta sp.]